MGYSFLLNPNTFLGFQILKGNQISNQFHSRNPSTENERPADTTGKIHTFN